MKKIILLTSVFLMIAGSSYAQTDITLTGEAPLRFTSTGTGTYNKTVIYHNPTYGLLFELAKNTDSNSGIPIDFNIDTRGGTHKFFTIKGSSGNVGIGTPAPAHQLHVVAENSSVQLRLQRTGNIPALADIGVDGTGMKFWVGGYGTQPSVILNPEGRMRIVDPQVQNWNLGFGMDGDPSRFLSIDVVNSALDTDPLELVYSRGSGVHIGRPDLPNKFLKVYGQVYAKEIKVTLSSFPDFVFEDDYNLPTLEEVEKFIKENHHLPEIPSERQVIEEGLNLGEMDAKLLQKIEELTLYTIQQEKKLEEQASQIKMLAEQNNAILADLQKLKK